MEGTLTTPGVAFEGEGGIGKTRLAYAAVDMAQQDGAAVIGMFGSPFYADVGLRPVRRLLERRCGIKRDSDPAERLRKLQAEVALRSLDPAAMVPLLAPVLGISSESGYQPASAEGPKLYGRIAGAIHDYLLACLGSGPALVFIDDVHWFDEDTVEVVQALLRETSGRLMVVITGRKLPPFADTTTVFQVRPLSDADADELVLALHPNLKRKARNASTGPLRWDPALHRRGGGQAQGACVRWRRIISGSRYSLRKEYREPEMIRRHRTHAP